ncbi:MAG TPA: type VI secretion system tip protein TssI/VgrG [Gemmatimonadaceae bacterium]|nr:type VI secretion system tip protein TssI/VgrG [Gemmatimonadaceae bacterium]
MGTTQYTQIGQVFSLHTPLGKDVLLLQGMTGEESVSQLFRYELDVLSEKTDVKAADLLGKSVTVDVMLPLTEGMRHINGVVSRFTRLGVRSDKLVGYRIEVVPWLWFMTLSRNSRVFQEMSVQQIVSQLLDGLQGHGEYKFTITGGSTRRKYCVQLGESDFDFVSRLLEEEGIFYFFQHEQGSHRLVLIDDPNMLEECPGQSAATLDAPSGGFDDEDVVIGVESEYAVHTGKATVTDYNFETPTLSLFESVDATDKGRGELYAHPTSETTEPTKDVSARQAKLLMDGAEASRHVLRGESNVRSFQCGHTFKLSGHQDGSLNRAYHLLSVRHFARVGGFHQGDGAPEEYRNEFVAIPSDVRYRPPRATPRPRVHGVQTAVVVGPSGEKVYVDRYGRIKVQFYWDREGKKNDQSSCWVRVATATAGPQWGAISVPRIGTEVLVSFVEGDPDRPLVTGSVYNADAMPPYVLPDFKLRSGVRTLSENAGAGSSDDTDVGHDGNALRFDDDDGKELVHVQAQKDLTGHVKNDYTMLVKHDYKLDVENDRTTTITKNDTRTVNGDLDKTTIAKDQTLEVQGKQDVTVTGDQTTTVKSGKIATTADGGTITIKASADKITLESPKEIELKVAGSSIVIKPTEIKLTVGPNTIAMSTTELKITVGMNSAKLDPAGVELKGLTLNLEGTTKTDLKGLMTTVNATGILSLGGPLTKIG